MKGFSKSLKAGMSAAAQAANDTLPAGYKFTGATSGGQRFRAPDVQTSPTPTRSPRRGDDGACEPGAHLLLRVEHAVGLDPHPTFVAVRVASALGELRGARAHTLPARPSPSGRHVWRATRNLRCVPRRGDLLLLDAYVGSDVTARGAAWDKIAWRGVIALDAVPSNGAPARVPLHRNLRRAAESDGRAFVVAEATVSLVPTTGARVSPNPNPIPNPPPTNDPFAASVRALTLDSGSIPRRRKRVFFVRHGESAWNEAQREYKLSKMIRFDHPLNAAGAAQATRFGEIAAATVAAAGTGIIGTGTGMDPFLTPLVDLSPATPSFTPSFAPAPRGVVGGGDDDWARSYAAAERCFTSPLTRAVQTAALILHAHPGALGAPASSAAAVSSPALDGAVDGRFETLAASFEGDPRAPAPGDGRVVLLSAAREVKSTMGSFDTIGIERGGGVLDRALAKFRELFAGNDVSASAAANAVASLAAKLDVNDCVGQWWTPKDDVDTSDDVDERVDDVFDALRFDASDVALLVGHSLFLQRVARRFISPRLFESNPELATGLKERKLNNCGCVGMDVEWDETTGTPSIVDARLLFGSVVGKAGAGAE